MNGDHQTRNQFLNTVYATLPDHHKPRINEHVKYEYQHSLNETLLLELLNLLGIKTPTEIHGLKTEKGFIIVKSKVGYKENKILSDLERQSLSDENLDAKSFIRYLFVANILRIHDIRFDTLLNALIVQNKDKTTKKPNIFDPKFANNYPMNLKNWLNQKGNPNFMDQDTFPKLFKEIFNHTNNQEIYLDLAKILYHLEKNRQEIQKVLKKYENLVDPKVLKILKDNLKEAENYLKNLNITSCQYQPNLENPNRHQAHKVPRQLSDTDLKNIAKELDYKNPKIVSSFAASEVESRKTPITRIVSQDSGYSSALSSNSSKNSNSSSSDVILLITRETKPLPTPPKLQKVATVVNNNQYQTLKIIQQSITQEDKNGNLTTSL